MIDVDGYRPNVGIVLLNAAGQLFWARRVNRDGWQFPQGGMRSDETPLEAMYRELEEETGLAPHRLELEITEGVLIKDPPRTLMILRRLKALGVKIAMDDFGTGYSSLSSLQSFPFDKIKIDRSFILGIRLSEQSRAIVRAVLGLGHTLNMPVIAEGVETEQQRQILLQLGCPYAQGYLFSKPLPLQA